MTDTILCGVVIEKDGERERFCTNPACYVYPLAGDNDTDIIDGIVLCQEHSDKFDLGKSLIARTRHGYRFMIQLILEPEDSTMDECNGAPPVVHNAPALA